MNEGISAIHELVRMGYRAWADGDNIRLVYEGYGEPEPATVAPLMTLVKVHKPEAIGYLSQNPQAPEWPTCFECGYFRPAVSSPNPTQAWGRCEKRNKGRFGVATACEIMAEASPDGD
jgi:hypothetical protein